jgi:MYXO-CTERM domain-containing protein
MKKSYLLILVAMLIPAMAFGFTRSRDSETGVCLWWSSRNVSYYINEACGDDVDDLFCINAVRASFDAWNGLSCTDMVLEYGGTTPDIDVGYDQKNASQNKNLIVWVESGWSSRHDPSAIGMTTTTYDARNGKIYDADVEMNGTNFTFTASNSTVIKMDIHNTLAHEVGHILGLDHSQDSKATMYATAPEGETKKRDIEEDDINGLCCIYPAGESASSCSSHPSGEDGWCEEGQEEVDDGLWYGCQSSGFSGQYWWLGLLGLGVIWGRRKLGRLVCR